MDFGLGGVSFLYFQAFSLSLSFPSFGFGWDFGVSLFSFLGLILESGRSLFRAPLLLLPKYGAVFGFYISHNKTCSTFFAFVSGFGMKGKTFEEKK